MESNAAQSRTRLSSCDGIAGCSVDADDDESHAHRLQRQDAKSRKTFKIRRNYGTVKDSSMSRSATLKVIISLPIAGLMLVTLTSGR